VVFVELMGMRKFCKIDNLCAKNEQDFEGDIMICFLNLGCLFLQHLRSDLGDTRRLITIL
jgi:hypothetical protein